jgi:flagellar motor switch protein FliM
MAFFVQFLESSLHKLVLCPVAITFVRSRERPSALDISSMSMGFRAVQAGESGLLSVDAEFIDALLCSVFGARRFREPPYRYSAVEQALVKRVLDTALGDLGRALQPWMNMDFVAGRLEAGPYGAGADSPGPRAFGTMLRISLGERAGVLRLFVPGALERTLFGSGESRARHGEEPPY